MTKEMLEKIQLLYEWQWGGYPVHPLICGHDSCDSKLMIGIREGVVFLHCDKCDWIQDDIPQVVLKADFKGLQEVLINMEKTMEKRG